MIKSICIVRLSALGDVLMLVPLIRTLQKYLPSAQLTWVISRPAYDLIEGMEGINFIVISKPKTLLDYWRLKKKLRGQKFDILLALQASFRANLLYPLIQAKRKIGYDKLRAKDGHSWFINETIAPGNDHTLDSFLKFLKPLNVLETDIRWDLPISNNDITWACNYLPDQDRHGKRAPVILINPAASKSERNWLAERYAEVIKFAQKKWNASIIITGGPTENDYQLGEVILAKVSNCLNLIGKTKPKQLLALISQSQVLICPDTGPSHMAAAVGTPVIALHAVTSAKVSCPYTFPDLVLDYYPQAVKKVFNKNPEEIPWGTHVHGQEAMVLIPTEAVLDKLTSVMSKWTCRTIDYVE